MFMNLFTVEEFAKKTKLCKETIRRAIKAGKINAFRPGLGIRSGYRIPESELERLLIMKNEY
jgi:excisionase family DNA binding protein